MLISCHPRGKTSRGSEASCEYYYTCNECSVSLERESRFCELTLNVLRPASRFSLSLWCIYNDLRITSAVTIDSIETPAEMEEKTAETEIPAKNETPSETEKKTVEDETPLENETPSRIETPSKTETKPAGFQLVSKPAGPVAFCCLVRESDDVDRLDLRGDFGAVCVDSARREVLVKSAKKNLAVPCARICDVFFVDQREHKGLAICHLTDLGRRSLLLLAPCEPSFSRETLFQRLNPLLPFPYTGNPAVRRAEKDSRSLPRKIGDYVRSFIDAPDSFQSTL